MNGQMTDAARLIDEPVITLGTAKRGFVGGFMPFVPRTAASMLFPAELESRLIEMGFVEARA